MRKRTLVTCLAALAVATLSGCGDNGMSQKEIEFSKNSPNMTDADRQKVIDGMAAGGAAARKSQDDWAKQNPAKAAEINAARAKMGRPPLGQ